MSNLGTLRARIAREMKRGDITADSPAVMDSIVSAIDYFANQRFFFNEFSDTAFSASSSVRSQTLPIIPVILDGVKVKHGNREYPLEERTWSWMDDTDSGMFYGYPDYYSWHTNSLRLYPPPNDSYSLVISGVKLLTEVSVSASNSASNAWTSDAEAMIRLQAKAYLWRDELRNHQESQAFMGYADVERKSLKKRTTHLTSGKLRGSW